MANLHKQPGHLQWHEGRSQWENFANSSEKQCQGAVSFYRITFQAFLYDQEAVVSVRFLHWKCDKQQADG